MSTQLARYVCLGANCRPNKCLLSNDLTPRTLLLQSLFLERTADSPVASHVPSWQQPQTAQLSPKSGCAMLRESLLDILFGKTVPDKYPGSDKRKHVVHTAQ